jgi:2,4-dienoyl-CoA reductase-like NADH-dependent reductase (Old Yellow Enzyme family)
MSTTAKIAAKGTQNTGLTEDLAKRFHDQLGRKGIAIVEFCSETRTEKRDGDETVGLSILTFEPATTQLAEDYLRELSRGFHFDRGVADGQLALDETLEPKVADILAAGKPFIPHPFLPANASEDNPICDVCGVVEDATRLHDEKSRPADPFTVPDPADDEPDDGDDLDDNTDDKDDEDDESN